MKSVCQSRTRAPRLRRYCLMSAAVAAELLQYPRKMSCRSSSCAFQ
jgi:hypothetical protein